MFLFIFFLIVRSPATAGLFFAFMDEGTSAVFASNKLTAFTIFL